MRGICAAAEIARDGAGIVDAQQLVEGGVFWVVNRLEVEAGGAGFDVGAPQRAS